MTSWYLGDLELPSAVGRNCCPQTLSKQCYAGKPRQLLQLPHRLGFITISQGCCDLSEELNWDACLQTVGTSVCLLFFVWCFTPSLPPHWGQLSCAQQWEQRAGGLKTSLPEPVLSVPLLWSQHIMCLGGTRTSARTAVMYSPGKRPWGGGSHTSLGTANPVILPFPVTK